MSAALAWLTIGEVSPITWQTSATDATRGVEPDLDTGDPVEWWRSRGVVRGSTGGELGRAVDGGRAATADRGGLANARYRSAARQGGRRPGIRLRRVAHAVVAARGAGGLPDLHLMAPRGGLARTTVRTCAPRCGRCRRAGRGVVRRRASGAGQARTHGCAPVVATCAGAGRRDRCGRGPYEELRRHAPSLHRALLAAKAAGHTHVLLDGTLIYTDRTSTPGPTRGWICGGRASTATTAATSRSSPPPTAGPCGPPTCAPAASTTPPPPAPIPTCSPSSPPGSTTANSAWPTSATKARPTPSGSRSRKPPEMT